MNVLVTSASRKVSLIRALMQGLQRVGGGRVVAADLNPLAAALYAADARELVPPSNDESFMDAIEELCERHAVDLIVPTRDEELPVFAAGRARLEQSGRVVAVSDSETIETCQDKIAFHAFALGHGFRVAPTFEDISSVEYPAFVRPRRGKGGAGSMVVRSRSELDVMTTRAGGDVIVQPLIDAPEYTIDLFVDLQGTPVSIVPRRRLRVVAGESYVGRVELRSDLIEVARLMAEAMAFRGHITVQCFAEENGPLLIEVNPRFGGAAALGWAAGAPTAEYLVRLVAGEPAGHDPSRLRDGLVMLRYTDDLYLTGEQLVSPTPA